jgi:small subunit ribosomal protein S1
MWRHTNFKKLKQLMYSLKKDNSISMPSIGSFVEGFILEKKERSLFIDLSPYGTGIIQGVNYIETKNYIKKLEIGTKVLVKILDWNNEDGLIEMALQNLEKEKAWEKIKEMKKQEATLPLLISEANAGGLMGKIENIKGFLPASQLSTEHYPKVGEGNKNKILEKLNSLIGKKISVKILDFDSAANKLIFSEKLVEKDKIKDIINKYNIGDKIQVKITKIVDFGAFVKLEDSEIDGLVHISQIPNESAVRINDILKEGEIKEAKIIGIDDDKISLSFKDLKEKKPKEA